MHIKYLTPKVDAFKATGVEWFREYMNLILAATNELAANPEEMVAQTVNNTLLYAPLDYMFGKAMHDMPPSKGKDGKYYLNVAFYRDDEQKLMQDFSVMANKFGNRNILDIADAFYESRKNGLFKPNK